MIRGSGGSKTKFAKEAGAEPCAQSRYQKIVRRCGPKHISKSKCTKSKMLRLPRKVTLQTSPNAAPATNRALSCYSTVLLLD